MMNVYERERAFWQQKLSAGVPAACFPYNRYTSTECGEASEGIFRQPLDVPISERVMQVAGGSPLTVFFILLAGVEGLLHHYTGENEQLLGIPVLRERTGSDKGLNTLVFIMNQLTGKSDMKALFRDIKAAASEAYAHQELPFWNYIDQIPGTTKAEGGTTYVPTIVGLSSIHTLDFIQETSSDLVLWFELDGHAQITLELRYNRCRYSLDAIERIHRQLQLLLSSLLNSPDLTLEDISLITEDDKKQLLVNTMHSSLPLVPQEKTIHELFQEQAKRTPARTAVVCGTERLTYAELDERSEQLARELWSNGVREGSTVSLLIDRSVDMLISILGILKAGAAYVPIDPSYPAERILYMLQDSGANWLITKSSLTNGLSYTGQIIDLEQPLKEERRSPIPMQARGAASLAYIIYTSGTTGNPKGVMVEHRQVVNLVHALTAAIKLPDDGALRYALLANYVFDVSIQQIFGSLLFGHELHVVPEEMRTDGGLLLQFFEDQDIYLTDCTPTHLGMLLHQAEISSRLQAFHPRYLLVAGEALRYELAVRFYRTFNIDQPIMFNVYGPTECCVYSTIYQVPLEPEALLNVPIGKPLGNYEAYILGRKLELLPIGVPGELYIGGSGVARGYLNRPELTAACFMENPYRPGHTMYRTGDRVRWLPDGRIEFLGRSDQQLKIRGYRIEPAEIEAKLLELEGILEAVVVAWDDSFGEKQLYAYVTTGATFRVEGWREELSRQLPAYMIPISLTVLEKLPLTPSGKLDHRALPKPEAHAGGGTSFVAPRDETEIKLAKIWEQVLGRTEIGIKDNFFELGGHSLWAARLTGAIYQELNVKLPIRDIFQAPTIEQMAAAVKNAKRRDYVSIPIADKREYYPVSSAQKRIYLLRQLTGGELGYNMPGVLEIHGPVEPHKVEEAFHQLILRHESLRTSFTIKDGEVVQQIHEYVEFSLEQYEGNEESVETIIQQFIRPFDLSSAPLLRAGLMKLDDQRHLLLFDTHHIIADGVSMSMLSREFIQYYQGDQLPPLSVQYKDFAIWQLEQAKDKEMIQHMAYWTNVFSDDIPVLELPTDRARTAMRSFEGDIVPVRIEASLLSELQALAQESGATLFMVLLAVYNVLLSKYSGQHDVVVGTPVSGREHPDVEQVMGMFVNTLPLRNYPKDELTFRDFLRAVRQSSLEAFDHSAYPFEQLVEQVQTQRELSRNPLFDVMLVLQNMDSIQLESNELTFSTYPMQYKIAKFDLTLTLTEEEDGLNGVLEYATALFHRDTAMRIAAHYAQLLGEAVRKPDSPLSELNMLLSYEKEQILEIFNATDSEYPLSQTIHGLFEEQVERTPNRTAVQLGNRSLTYAELNTEANRTAHCLRNLGVQPDTVVAIMMERSMDMMIGLFGILKAGGAYLPIDPKLPVERIRYMLQDSGASILLCQDEGHPVCTEDLTVTALRLKDASSPKLPASNPPHTAAPANLAYVIYTSGSTGQPKGVMIEHHSVINRLHWMQKQYPLSGQDVILQKTPYTFDVSVWELFWWSWYGASLCFLEPEGEKDPTLITRTIIEEKVTTLHFVPPMLSAFLDYLENHRETAKAMGHIKHIFVSGEALPKHTVERFYSIVESDQIKLVNLYGPTEATVDVSSFECTTGLERIPIGKPIDNIRLYVVDHLLRPLPIGIPGELCIAGAGLARGYLGRPELTEQKFVRNPFQPDTRMYRTGDIARWLPDGNLEYLGRMDHQVKLRGYRIELGEIVEALKKHPVITDAVVIDRTSADGSKFLCAYLVSAGGITDGECREHLLRTLPVYMVPAYFVRLDALPLTANGKLNRRALPEPVLITDIECETSNDQPVTALEAALAGIWKDILGRNRIGIFDDFFLLGGDSIVLLRLANRIQKDLGMDIELKELYTHRSISALAAYLSSSSSATGQTQAIHEGLQLIEAFQEKAQAGRFSVKYDSMGIEDFYPLSKIQQSMVYYSMLKPDQPIYHDQFFFTVAFRPWDSSLIERITEKLAHRHPILRTVFDMDTLEEPVQIVLRHAKPDVAIEDCRHLGADEQRKFIDHRRSMDLQNKFLVNGTLLWRLRVFRLGEENAVILLSFHHAVLDGWSVAVFEQEFIELYNMMVTSGHDEPLEELDHAPLRCSYKDYVALNAYKQADIKTEQFWTTYLSGYNRGKLPFNLARKPLAKNGFSTIIRRPLPTALSERLEHRSRQYGCKIRDLCLSAHLYLLRVVTGEEDIVTGVVSHDRPTVEDGDRILGCFLNTLPIRLQINKREPKEQLVRNVSEIVYRINAHEAFLSDIARMIGERTDPALNPIFDTLFNYTEFHVLDFSGVQNNIRIEESSGLELRNSEMTNTLLDVEVHRGGEQINVQIKYSPQYFYEQDMETVFTLYVRILEKLCDTDNRYLDSA
ncbi:non-ribosomal peptide synthetase, partial [Paenibacillus xylaniclasticus]|uniref:non-ribosomal peptide synthetase n=1 Tax=Paenibacillus xylaniclasticus TaxID=588083 RepID=UPI0013E09E1C